MKTKQEQTSDDIKETAVEILTWEGVKGGAQHGDLEDFNLKLSWSQKCIFNPFGPYLCSYCSQI